VTTLAVSSVDTFPVTHNQREAAEELARPCCPRCGIPRSEYEGHHCLYQVDGEWVERQWSGWDE
jgi:hypothetical protein